MNSNFLHYHQISSNNLTNFQKTAGAVIKFLKLHEYYYFLNLILFLCQQTSTFFKIKPLEPYTRHILPAPQSLLRVRKEILIGFDFKYVKTNYFYEKPIRKTDDYFSVEEYEIFQIIKE